MSDDATVTTETSLDAVEESAVWLDLNGAPAVTWMCTPERLDELVVGWLFGEGYIDRMADVVRMRPCTSELGFWVEVPPDKYDTVERAERRRVLASGCGAVVKEYARHLARDPDYAHKAERVSALTKDLSELLPDLVPALKDRVGPPRTKKLAVLWPASTVAELPLPEHPAPEKKLNPAAGVALKITAVSLAATATLPNASRSATDTVDEQPPAISRVHERGLGTAVPLKEKACAMAVLRHRSRCAPVPHERGDHVTAGAEMRR